MPLDSATPMLGFAAYLGDPAAWLGADFGLEPETRASMAESRVLRPVLNRYLAEQAGIAKLGFDARFLAKLDDDADLRQAVALAMADDAVVQRAAKVIAAALFSDVLRQAILKADRERLLAELGAEAMEFGLRRASVFARGLADVTLPAGAADGMAGQGLAVLAAMVARGHRALGDLMRLRYPALPARTLALSERQEQTGWAILAMQGGIL